MATFTKSFKTKTSKQDMLNITSHVRSALAESDIKNGTCIVYCPHTTAGITVNENADPDVVRDLLFALDKTCPDRPEFRHFEGNSAAHLKSSIVGCQQTFIVKDADLILGTWQGIYFCEFDGPRTRTFHVSITGE